MGEYIVYILRCSDGSFYTGITNDLERRFCEHHEGQDPTCYTFKRRPLQLVYIASFQEVTDAILWEKKVKRWSRKKKEALISREYEKLPELAKCKNITEYLKNKILRNQRYILRNHISVILSSVEG